MSRSNVWLSERLEYIWATYFSDIKRITPIRVHFGQRAYRRLGSIILRPQLIEGKKVEVSWITISSLLADDDIPDLVIDQVLAHELVHYVHGFGSHYPRILHHPHQGGVILKEFKKRGLWELYRVYLAWIKLHWRHILRQEGQI